MYGITDEQDAKGRVTSGSRKLSITGSLHANMYELATERASHMYPVRRAMLHDTSVSQHPLKLFSSHQLSQVSLEARTLVLEHPHAVDEQLVARCLACALDAVDEVIPDPAQLDLVLELVMP